MIVMRTSMVVKKNCYLIDLRQIKRLSAKINEMQKDRKYHIINGNLNLLGWVLLKSKNVIGDKYEITLAETSIVKPGKYWQKLVNTDEKRSILFPDDYHGTRFENNDFPFFKS